MLTTEAEAKTKRCQESFPACTQVSPEGSTWAVAHSGGAYAMATAPSFCLGSACMAWRWGKVINVYEPIPEQEKAAKGADFTVRQELGGYCGKAGKPVQLNMEDAP